MILLTVLGTIGVLLLLASMYFCRVVTKPKKYSRSYSYNFVIERDEFEKSEFESLHKEPVIVKSPFGYDLSGYFFPNGESKRVVVFCHGITWNLFGSIKYMMLFRELGFAGIAFDHRNHGESGANTTTFGKYEKHDLGVMVKWIRDRFGNDAIVGLHGESLGAAVALQYLTMDQGISFCVADCPFSDLPDLLKLRMKNDYRLPPFPLINLAGFFSRLSTGLRFAEASPRNALKGVNTPILFVHGKEDRYIPPEMSLEMAEQQRTTRKVYLAPEAGHAESFLKNRDRYREEVIGFMKAFSILDNKETTQ